MEVGKLGKRAQGLLAWHLSVLGLLFSTGCAFAPTPVAVEVPLGEEPVWGSEGGGVVIQSHRSELGTATSLMMNHLEGLPNVSLDAACVGTQWQILVSVSGADAETGFVGAQLVIDDSEQWLEGARTRHRAPGGTRVSLKAPVSHQTMALLLRAQSVDLSLTSPDRGYAIGEIALQNLKSMMRVGIKRGCRLDPSDTTPQTGTPMRWATNYLEQAPVRKDD